MIEFDDARMAALYVPPLSTARIPTVDIGQGAMVEMLHILDHRALPRGVGAGRRLLSGGFRQLEGDECRALRPL